MDLLRKVEQPSPKLNEPENLTPKEVKLLLDAYDRDTFKDVPDRPLIAILAATGLRYNAVLTIRTQDYDRVTGEFKVHEKGDEGRPAPVDGRARRFLNLYLARRPRTAAADRLWLTDVGSRLSCAGGQMIVRRARNRGGITVCPRTCFGTASPIGLPTRARFNCCSGTAAPRWRAATRVRRPSGRARG